jgi:nucleoid DNA-binding protein
MANTIGAGLVSGMLLALAAAETPPVKAGLNNQLANNAAVTQGTRNATVSGIAVQQYTLTIGSSASASVELDLSDFGNFSLATRIRSVLLSTTTTFQMRDIQLR